MFESVTLLAAIVGFIAITVALALSISIVSNSHPSLAESIMEASYREIFALYAGLGQIIIVLYGSEYGPRTKEPKDDTYYILDDP